MKKLIPWIVSAGAFACFASTAVQAQTRQQVITASQSAVNYILADSNDARVGTCFSCHNTGQAIRAGAMAELSPDLTVNQSQLNNLVTRVNNQQFTDVAGTGYGYWAYDWWYGYYWVGGTQDGRYDGAITHENRNPYTDGSAHPNTTTSWAIFSLIGFAGNPTATPFVQSRFMRGAAFLERMMTVNGLAHDHWGPPVDSGNPGETARAVMVLVKARQLDGQAHWTTAINNGVAYLRGVTPRNENFYYVQDAGWIVQALTAAGFPASDTKVAAMVTLIKGRQAVDGGWSMATTASAIGTSDAFGTGVALMSLLAVGETNSSRYPDFRRGINWLLTNQASDGGWASTQGVSRVSGSTWAVLSLTALATTPPSISVPEDMIVEATGPSGAVVTYVVSAIDPNTSQAVPVTVSRVSGSTFPLGTTTVTATATIDGETATNSFTVTVRDTTRPVLTLPANQTLEATGPGGAVATFSASATDFISGPRPVTYTYASGSTFPVGTTIVTVSATDAAGNTATGGFSITVRDTTAPTIASHADVTALPTSPDGAVVMYVLPSATDLVDNDVVVIGVPASGSMFPIGTTRVNVTAIDRYNNRATSSFNVIVQDITPPVITTVPANQVLEATSAAGAVATFAAAATDDVTASPTITFSINGVATTSGSTFPLGTTTVTVSASDATGNTSTRTFTITVRDTIAPAITVPTNIVTEATSAAGATVSFSTSSSDIVSGNVTVTASPASGSTFALGANTVTLTATDAAGNTATRTFTVTVRDTTAPVITAPADIIAEATGPAGRVVTFSASSSDIVSGNVTVTASPVSGSTFALGTTTVTLTATDGAGNTTTRTFTVTVRDTTAPAITVPADIVTEATSAAGATVTFSTSAADIVSGNVAANASPVSGSTFPLGTSTVTVTATDAAGNTASRTFTVTVRDTTAPVITAPANTVTEATSAAGATVTFSTSASDIVSGNVAVTPSAASGSTFAIGTTTVTLTATDAAGNTATRTFTVTVRDTIAPTFTSLTPSSRTLWPPNHQMVAIRLTAVTSDTVGVASTRIISVTSNEPDNGLGDGDTAGDIQVTGDLTLNLRAERAGNGNGRTYTITVRAQDAAGNFTNLTTTVSVPKSQGGR